jgi:hypothetical protein
MVSVTFQTSFSGAKNDYLIANDQYGLNSGWQQMGTWTVPASQQYYLTTAVSPSGGGTISPASGWYTSGSQVTITATPYSGYQFSSFTGTVNSSSNPLTVTMNSAMTETANFVATSQYTATTLADLNNCIQNLTQYTTCTLAPGTYAVTITSTISINRSNVAVTGGGSTRAQTVLVRDPAYTGPMMQVNASTPLTGVTIQNLTFCGNNTLSNASPNPACPPRVQTTCGNWTDLATQGNPLPEGAVICTDLEVDSVDTGANPANPFSYSGPYSLTIANVALEDAAGHAVSLFPTEYFGQRVKDVYIHDSAINNSAVTGILLGSNTPTNYGDRKVCDNNPNFSNDTSVSLPRNIRIESNSFGNNNTGTIAGGMRWLALRNNSFTNNFKNWQVEGNATGGTIFIDQCGDTVEISGNTTFTGPAPSDRTNGASGLELWGRNITVQGNTISGYPSEGIGVNSAYNVTITSNWIQNNSRRTDAALLGGIQIQARSLGACSPIPRDVDTITISANHSNYQPYGVLLGEDAGDSRNTINSATIATDNDLTSNTSAAIWLRPMVTLNAYSGLAPTPDPGSTRTPRALAIDTVSPITSRCSTPGSDRETFKFAAGEVTGAGNVSSLEGVFSIPGNDADGTGGPGPSTGAPYCHFFYDRGTNVVYLDDQNASYTWSGGSSVVGPGGSPLSNGYCRIYAGSASSAVQVEAKVLSLILDVEFLSSTYLSSRKHMYVVVENTSGQFSTGDGGNPWKYWGWWATP